LIVTEDKPASNKSSSSGEKAESQADMEGSDGSDESSSYDNEGETEEE